MNENNIFKGECYMCGKIRFITRVDSWCGQRTSDGIWVPGSWRMFCDACVKEWGWERNRDYNICSGCSKKFIGSKATLKCKICRCENGKTS